MCVCVCVCVCGRVVSTQRARPHSLNWSRARLGNAEGFADGFNEGFADSFADGVADSFADGDGDVRMRSVAPRRAATAAAAAGRAAPRSRAAELAFTNVKDYLSICGRDEPPKPQYREDIGFGSRYPWRRARIAFFLAAGTLCEHSARAGALAQRVL